MARRKTTPPPWPLPVALLVLAGIVAALAVFASRVELPDTAPAPGSVPAQIPVDR